MIERLNGTVISVDLNLQKHPRAGYYYYQVLIRLDKPWNRAVVELQLIPEYTNYQNWSWILEPQYRERTRVEGFAVIKKLPHFINKDIKPEKVIKPQAKVKKPEPVQQELL